MAIATKRTKARPSPKIGAFLTDGLRLYRVEALLPNRGGVVLEDCRSYQLISLDFDQFRRSKLETVNA